MRRAYDQYCPIAHALDLVGERWSLLVVRELMRGPKRYTDLAEQLGIGTNILAARLRDLEVGGVVTRRTLPPPAVLPGRRSLEMTHEPPSPWRIVVTDDDPQLMSFMVGTLRSAGHCVFAAYDGDSASHGT